MIKKFKDWFKSKPKPVDTTTKFNLSEFRSESKDLLSYILDDSSIVLTIDTYSHDYKVNLMVVKNYDSDFMQELDEQINGYKVINFYDIKDDFVSYFTYIHSKYKGVDSFFEIINDNNFNYNNFTIKDLENIPNLEFNRISFYIRKPYVGRK